MFIHLGEMNVNAFKRERFLARESESKKCKIKKKGKKERKKKRKEGKCRKGHVA